jgi:hypothetical protein
MSGLQRSGGSRPSRRSREQRAFSLVLASGTFSVLAVITFVLAIVGVTSFGWFVLMVVLAAISVMLFRRSVS